MDGEVGAGKPEEGRGDAALPEAVTVTGLWRELWTDAGSPQLSLAFAHGLAGFFVPATLGGIVATLVFAAVAYRLAMWPAWL